MTIVVNPTSEQEEKVLIAFLDSLKYDYQTEEEAISLTGAQEQEILLRDKNFGEGKTTSRPWSEIKKELERVYR